MKKNETKKRILEIALTLFAEKGYGAVTMSDIANELGIKAPSLYKHYAGKRDIFESLLREMAVRYRDFADRNSQEGVDPAISASEYATMDIEVLVAAAYSLFQYFLHDPYASRFRRLLAMESFRNPEIARLFVEQYIDAPIQFQGSVFGIFMRQGFFKTMNPQIAAFHFYSPVFLLLALCDNHPEREPEALEIISRHITQFSELYGKDAEGCHQHGNGGQNE